MIYKEKLQQEKTTHPEYVSYLMKQIVGEFEINDQITLVVNGAIAYSYVMQYGKCHFNLTVQDTSTTPPTELEKLQREKAELEARILALEGG